MTDLEALFRSEYPGLVRARAVAWRSTTAAEDAVQEAFLRYSKLDERPANPAAWVRRAAVNGLIDQHRRTQTRARVAQLLAADDPSLAGPDHDRVDLAEALAKLSDQQRTAVCLFYIGDLPVAEVAVAMGVAEGTVKKHLFDARARLHDLLGASHG